MNSLSEPRVGNSNPVLTTVDVQSLSIVECVLSCSHLLEMVPQRCLTLTSVLGQVIYSLSLLLYPLPAQMCHLEPEGANDNMKRTFTAILLWCHRLLGKAQIVSATKSDPLL